MVVVLDPFQWVHDDNRAALLQIPDISAGPSGRKEDSLETTRVCPSFHMRQELIFTMLSRSFDISVVCFSVFFALIDLAPI
jgi:hypothetical protein